MSIEKAELKMAMAQEIGVRLDDVLDSAEKLEVRLSGVPDWLRKAAGAVVAIHGEIEKQVEDGKLELPAAQALKDIITKAHERVLSVSAQAEVEQKIAAGRIAGLRVAVEVTKRAHGEEQAKATRAASLAAVAEDGSGGRPVSIKAQRVAEAGVATPDDAVPVIEAIEIADAPPELKKDAPPELKKDAPPEFKKDAPPEAAVFNGVKRASARKEVRGLERLANATRGSGKRA